MFIPKNLILKKSVKLNNSILENPSKKIFSGDEIVLNIPEPKKASLKPYKYKLDLVYEDDDLLVINKSSGISIHPGAVDTPFWDGTGVDFNREEMLNTNTLAQSIVHAIQSPENFVVEELVVRITAGDF